MRALPRGLRAGPPVDAAELLDPGPWRHRFVTANGCRFHVAESGPDDGSAPLVLLLHGFPQSWRAWKHQLAALPAAGYRAAALDLRGSGASDKPPRGYDTATLAADAAGVVRALGAQRAVLVGSGWGAWAAWASASLQPATTAAVASLGEPHPLQVLREPWRVLTPSAARHLARVQVPAFPEWAVRDGSTVERVLREWGAPGWADADVVAEHAAALRVPFAAHAALECYRWVARSRVRADGHAFARAVSRPARVPVLSAQGELDGAVVPGSCRRSAAWAAAGHRWAEVPGAGHFLGEEAPATTTELLLDWLDGLPTA
ncbi:alpha/beta fold hydrolase [Quadrisphaera sp. KR29]|uniref:alpha/beta fold hydrolase n=1 Tax=Quadrisphaera sp. KR29 TaxID=3461391 RepID=UPI004044F9CE